MWHLFNGAENRKEQEDSLQLSKSMAWQVAVTMSMMVRHFDILVGIARETGEALHTTSPTESAWKQVSHVPLDNGLLVHM